MAIEPAYDDPGGGRTAHRVFGASPAWLLLPILSLVVGVIYFRAFDRGGSDGARPAPPNGDELEELVAWSGQAKSGGLIYQARLAPLHAAEERLAFDRARLDERFGLGDGGPWRLEVRLDADPDGPAPEADAGIDLALLAVRDDAGGELRRALRAEQPAADMPSDPLRTLLGAAGRIEPGQRGVLVLWGERPGPGAELSGLPVPLALEETTLPASVTERALHRVDAMGGER